MEVLLGKDSWVKRCICIYSFWQSIRVVVQSILKRSELTSKENGGRNNSNNICKLQSKWTDGKLLRLSSKSRKKSSDSEGSIRYFCQWGGEGGSKNRRVLENLFKKHLTGQGLLPILLCEVVWIWITLWSWPRDALTL